jgi:DNA-directed RNA polymerase subunit M/transcription elongation factor TFIIS
MANRAVVTHSYAKPPPEWYAEYLAAEAARKRGGSDAGGGGGGKAGAKRATVKEECPKCKHPFMEFYTMQLRSADEGQTVFYECPAATCGHKFSINT